MNKTQDWKDRAAKAIMPLYDIKNAILDHGEGCYLYDIEGKKYLDCAAGIAVASLGHGNTEYTKTAIDQLNKFIISPGSFQSVPKIECAELLIEHSFADQVFFTNSGAEAVEGSLKLARKWAHLNKGESCKEIITFDNSFHGRTYGAVSCTYKSKSQPEFAPYLPGIHFATFNDIESVRKLVSDKTCAILVEPVQGEGGVLPADKEFLAQLRHICDENKIILIFDEIQVGMGRLGTLFAYEHFGVEPDIMTLAKGMGNGFPVGAFVARGSISGVFKYGDHGSTYAGNPLATSIVMHTINQIRQPAFLQNVVETGKHLKASLEQLQKDTNSIEDIRGLGLMIGIDTVYDIGKLMNALLENGLMTTQAGAKSLRLTPPLIMKKEEADEAVEKIAHVIRKGDL